MAAPALLAPLTRWFAQYLASERTYFSSFARVVQLGCGLAFFLTGVLFWVRPEVMRMLGVEFEPFSDGEVELRAFYGTMEMMLGAFMVSTDALNGLRCGGMILFGCSAGRILAMMSSGGGGGPKVLASSVHTPIALAEFLGVLLTGFASLGEAKAKREFTADKAWASRRQSPDPSKTKLEDFVPFCPENIQNPFPFYKALREHAPVYKPKGLDYYLVSRAAEIQAVLRNPDVFSSNLVQILVASGAGAGASSSLNVGGLNAGGIVDVLALQDPPVHTVQRKIAFSGLTPKLFAKLDDKIRTLAKSLLVDLKAKQDPVTGADWIDLVCLRLPMVVALELIGFPSDEATVRRTKSLGDQAVLLMSAVNTPEQFQRNTAAGYELFAWVKAQYREKKAAPREELTDFLGVMVDAVHAKEMTDDEVQSVILQILLAGNDSSASTMGACVKALCDFPHIQDLVRGNPKELIPVFVEEVLRFESAFAGHFRKVTQPTELGGVPLKRGDRVMLLWASANRDEKVFENPDEFRMDRGAKGKAHYSFGNGIHACLGSPLARREIRIVLEELLSAFSSVKPAPGGPAPYYVDSTFVRSLGRFHVVVGE